MNRRASRLARLEQREAEKVRARDLAVRIQWGHTGGCRRDPPSQPGRRP
jgi:hypothetical protein